MGEAKRRKALDPTLGQDTIKVKILTHSDPRVMQYRKIWQFPNGAITHTYDSGDRVWAYSDIGEMFSSEASFVIEEIDVRSPFCTLKTELWTADEFYWHIRKSFEIYAPWCAGHDTRMGTIAGLSAVLMNCPNVIERVIEEIETVFVYHLHNGEYGCLFNKEERKAHYKSAHDKLSTLKEWVLMVG